MRFTGKAHKYGANVDTDVIIPARYLNVSEAAALAEHCMEDIDPGFRERMRPGDIMVAEANFGCGSSREHAPLAIKTCGVSCVIAKSFARIFFRNALNIGLPILECEEAVDGIQAGHEVEVDLTSGAIVNRTTGQAYAAKPYPPFMLDLIEADGLVEQIKRKVGSRS